MCVEIFVAIGKNSICSSKECYTSPERWLAKAVQSHCACWKTCLCFFIDSPRDMETRWVAVLLPFNQSIHLCGIHAHWLTPAHCQSQASCTCCRESGDLLLDRMYLCYNIRHARHLSDQSVYLLLSQSCDPVMKCKPLLSETMISTVHWCYFCVLAESIDEIWQRPTHQDTNISFIRLYQIKQL